MSLQLETPPKGTPDWHDILNGNFERIMRFAGDVTMRPAAYQELRAMCDAGTLVPGKKYLLTDYACVSQPNSHNNDASIRTGPVEPLILTAVAANKFDETVQSVLFPEDIIRYEFYSSEMEYGAHRNGEICYRENPAHRISARFDWRNVIVPRYKATGKIWVPGTEVARQECYQSGTNLYLTRKAGIPASAADPNYFTRICGTADYFWWANSNDWYPGITVNTADYADRYTFNQDTSLTKKAATRPVFLPQLITLRGVGNVFYYNDENDAPYNVEAHSANSFLGGANQYIDIPHVSGCIFGAASRVIRIGAVSGGNIFGTNCVSITAGNTFQFNIIGSGASLLTFGEGCARNMLGDGAVNSTFGNNADVNTAGNAFNNNTLSGSVHYNHFGDNCRYMHMPGRIGYCTFGDDTMHLIIKDLNSKNISAVGGLRGKSYYQTIESRDGGGYVYWHLDADNVPVYTSIA